VQQSQNFAQLLSGNINLKMAPAPTLSGSFIASFEQAAA